MYIKTDRTLNFNVGSTLFHPLSLSQQDILKPKQIHVPMETVMYISIIHVIK